MRGRIIRLLARNDTLLSPDAYDYLKQQEDPYGIVKSMVGQDGDMPLQINEETLRSFMESDGPKNRVLEGGCTAAGKPEPDIEVKGDITGNSTCTGEFEDFLRCFNDRFNKIKNMLTSRAESRDSMKIAQLKSRTGEGKAIGMVSEIHSTSKGNKVLSLEDETGTIKGLIKKDSQAYGKNLLEDEVIMAKGEVWGGNKNYDKTLNIEDIVRPGVPRIRSNKRSDFEGKIGFIGDVHVGSEAFLKDSWRDFIDWINSGSNVVEDIRYLVVTGDLVEGIGIYPGQKEELVIKDIYEQYREFARMMKDIPQDIEIITIPGNHDIVRNAEPQPGLPEDIKDMFPDNVHFYGNPTTLELDELKMLLYHGSSINDLSDLMKEVDTNYPITAMKQMMKRRHLLPVYGQGTSMAPEKEDHLVIEEVPDIFVTGHIHQSEVKKYRDMVMINSSTWQAQTEYQMMRGIQPDPAKVVLYEPARDKVTVNSFAREE